MISSDEFRKLALSLPEAEEQDHFDRWWPDLNMKAGRREEKINDLPAFM